MYMLVGGSEKFSGPIIGTAILVMIPEAFRGLKVYTPLLLGAIMLVVVYFMPRGLAGLLDHVKSKLESYRDPRVPNHAA